MIKTIALIIIILASSWLVFGFLLTAGMALFGASIFLGEITGAWFIILVIVWYEYIIHKGDK